MAEDLPEGRQQGAPPESSDGRRREVRRRRHSGTGIPLQLGREPPSGRSTPTTLEDVEGCFDSLSGVVATESATLAELVKPNAILTTTNVTLTATILKLTKAVNDLTEVKKGCGSGGGGGGGRGDAKHCLNCKRDTWHKPDECFELAKNKEKRPSYWKSCL